jgi:hypothetical protein
MAEQTQPIDQPLRRARPETSAWLLLMTFFLVFCVIVAIVGFLGWRSYTGAMEKVDGSVVRVHARAGVTYQAKGSAKQDTPVTPCGDNPTGAADACQQLGEGDSVHAQPEAGYGPVASITLPDKTRIADMYAYPTGADLTLTKYQASRWSHQRQEVEFRQTAGYVRYDIPAKDNQPYDDVSYSVVITKGVSIALEPGGSYSISVPHAGQGQPPALAASGLPLMAEVAVRAGSAEIQTHAGTVAAQPNKKVQVDANKTASQPIEARWELIRDPTFEQHKTGIYSDGFDAWNAYREKFDQAVTKNEMNGLFSVYLGCRPLTPVLCNADQSTYIGQFHREGDQTKSFIVGVSQTLDLDISEYRSLRFSMSARVIQQKVPQAGIANIECPITIQFTFQKESLRSPEERRYICVYQTDTNKPIATADNLGEWIYRGVPQNQWYQLTYELRDPPLLPSARYLKEIRIYANGHDYISEVTDVSLIASQQR